MNAGTISLSKSDSPTGIATLPGRDQHGLSNLRMGPKLVQTEIAEACHRLHFMDHLSMCLRMDDVIRESRNAPKREIARRIHTSHSWIGNTNAGEIADKTKPKIEMAQRLRASPKLWNIDGLD